MLEPSHAISIGLGGEHVNGTRPPLDFVPVNFKLSASRKTGSVKKSLSSVAISQGGVLWKLLVANVLN